ncbi:ATP-binding protein [Avibacterium paragallinarum]|uniref:ATP-binding protein n=1 Tax=Avibacterium paragallinarum TaxID=728 RepID=UPI0021F7493E|nr:ATP-binding protein [Avibacterium paragallinarum]UXN34424.1 ATP-binding protein [Avibacterium paragallinarum]
MRSIKARLSFSLILTVVIVAILGSGWTFYDTYYQTHKLQDEMLKQISSYISPHFVHEEKYNENGIAVYFIAKDKPTDQLKLPENPQNDFYTFARKKGHYAVLNKKKNSFHYDLKNAGELYRGYLRTVPQGVIVVLQENEYREDLAIHAALANFLPFMLILPLIAVLIYVITRQTMQPVERLSQKVLQRSQQDLTPLPTNHLPNEITGFVLAINQFLARTDRFIQQQKRFIADASHELRSPMTVISLQAERLAQHPLPTETAQQVAQLNQSIQRSRHLLEQLLSLARMQNGEKTHRTLCAIQSVFSQVIADLYPLAEQKQQDLGVESPQPIFFQGNETELYLLIKTLVDNAIRYTPTGSRIDLWAEDRAEHLILNVEDNGNGIPATERQRVFDPFYRILGSDQMGSGLGLAIAQQIVQNYGGKIELRDSLHFPTGLWVRVSLAK